MKRTKQIMVNYFDRRIVTTQKGMKANYHDVKSFP